VVTLREACFKRVRASLTLITSFEVPKHENGLRHRAGGCLPAPDARCVMSRFAMRRVRANLSLITSFKQLKHEYDRGTGQRLLACAKIRCVMSRFAMQRGNALL
jgi:hypothetical protein